MPPRPAILGLVLLGAVACSRERPKAIIGDGCVEWSVVEFGELPFGSEITRERLLAFAAPGSLGDYCPLKDGGELLADGDCEFRGKDGVDYSMYDDSIVLKGMSLSANERAPLSLTSATHIDEVRRRLRKAGAVARPSKEDNGADSLEASICPAGESLSWFEVVFDPAGRAQSIALRAVL